MAQSFAVVRSSLLDEATLRRPRLTNKALIALGALTTIECINANLLMPYADSMVSDFLQTTSDDPSVAHVVGLLMGLYSICQCIFSALWGALSDRVGRKPVLLIGTMGGCVAAPILLGLGTNLTAVCVARALGGFFCGNPSVLRTYMGEIVDETNEARGFGFLQVCYGIGLFIGPALGGELVYPANWAPSLFAGTIFERRPFLLPNLTCAALGVVAWIIGAVFLEETLPEKSEHGGDFPRHGVPSRVFTTPTPVEVYQTCPNFSGDVDAVEKGDRIGERQPPGTRALAQVVVCYCAINGWITAAGQLFILIVSFPQAMDGLALGPRQIGALQNVAAAAVLVDQLLFYQLATARVGLFWSFILGWTLFTIAHLIVFPVCGIWADSESFGSWRYVPLALMQFLQGLGMDLMYTTAYTFINRASADNARGAVNGWADSSAALCRAISPPCAAFLLTWGNGANAHWGRYISVYVNCIVGTLLVAIALPGMYEISAAKGSPDDPPAHQRPAATSRAASTSTTLTWP